MIRNWIFTAFILVLFSGLSLGQATTPSLLDGILLFEEGEYYESVHQIANLLGKREIPESDLPKANFFLGQSYLGLVRDNPNFRKKNPFAVARAFTHTQTAQMLGHGGRYTDLASAALQTLQPYLYNEGVYYFNEGEFRSADYYFEKALVVNPTDYEATLSRSFVALAEGDTNRAIVFWQNMSQSFDRAAGDSVPPAIEESYQLLANYYQQQGKSDSAFEVLTSARDKFPESIALKNSKLQVYKDQPLRQEEAVHLFEDILDKYPEDTKSALAYAELLQFMGKTDTAMILYEQVLATDSSELLAHKNLAIYQLNQAVALFEKLPDIKKAETKALHEQSINNWLGKAWPHFEVLHKAEPDEEMWLEQLALISKRLDRPDAEMYAQKLEAQSKAASGE